MCGRISQTSSRTIVAEEFGVANFAIEEPAPRYNIPPTQRIQTIARIDDERRLGLMYWGFTVSHDVTARPINARSETVASSPMFRNSFRQRRCLIPADGFYEWRGEGSRKIPYHIHLKNGRPFGLAGIWTVCGKDESRLVSCTILTCPPNQLLNTIHNRMPVIISPDQYGEWLDPDIPPERLREMLVPFPTEPLEAYPVSTIVNSPRNDGPECIQRTGDNLTFGASITEK